MDKDSDTITSLKAEKEKDEIGVKIDVNDGFSLDTDTREGNMVFGSGFPPSKRSIFLLFFKQASVNVLSNIMGYFPLLFNTIVAGHLGDVKKLDGIGVSSTMLAMSVTPVMLGLNRA